MLDFLKMCGQSLDIHWTWTFFGQTLDKPWTNLGQTVDAVSTTCPTHHSTGAPIFHLHYGNAQDFWCKFPLCGQTNLGQFFDRKSNFCPIAVQSLSQVCPHTSSVNNKSNNSYQKYKVRQNDVQPNLTWTDIGRMHPGFVHTLSKKVCSANTQTGIGYWHPEFVHSLSNNFLIPPNTTFLLVDKVWTKIGH